MNIPETPDAAMDLSRFCVIDIGSTTTKAILFVRKEGQWSFTRAEDATTVEKPYEDVTFGVLNALRRLEKMTGETLVRDNKPGVTCLSTSSAGGGLAIVVAGLMRDVTTSSAERVALGAGCVIQDIISLDDGRTPYKKVEVLKTLRPDMLLLAGGFDGGAMHGPVFLAELINQSNLRPKLSETMKLPVIFAGNTDVTEYAREILAERFMFTAVPNIRPESNRENLDDARREIHDLFMDHVMSRAPGYDKYRTWISSQLLPTPAAVGKILALASRDMKAKIMAIDIGGATTDVFTAEKGKVFRTVSANLGMSYSILNVVKQAGLEPILSLLDFDISETSLLDRIGNKFLNPTTLPTTIEDTKIECAVAAMAIREAVREHLHILHGVSLNLSEEELGWHMFRRRKKAAKSPFSESPLKTYDMVLGSGGRLSHSPRCTAAMILLNALEPEGSLELAVDSVFMFPHLGVLSDVDEKLALELFYKFGLIRLGRVIAPTGAVRPGKGHISVKGRTVAGRDISITVSAGELGVFGLERGEEAQLEIRAKRLNMNSLRFEIDDRKLLLLDVRGRPPQKPAGFMLPNDFEPQTRTDLITGQQRRHTGDILVTRELAVPGEVLVKVGDKVSPENIVANSTRSFLRPFFLKITGTLGIAPERLGEVFHRKVGDSVQIGEILAEYRPNLLEYKAFRSPVAGTVEKILPNGTVVVREDLEYTGRHVTVKMAEDLQISPGHLVPYLQCEVGQEVDRGQWLAAMTTKRRYSVSPIRGKIKDLSLEYGVAVIEPLLEELRIDAWVPGEVTKVTEKGCVLKCTGTDLTGAWGVGGEAYGKLAWDQVAEGGIVAMETVTAGELAQLIEAGVRGLVVGSLNLDLVYDTPPEFPVIVMESFGAGPLPSETRGVFEAHDGKHVSISAHTQLRAGVIRPRVVLVESQGGSTASM